MSSSDRGALLVRVPNWLGDLVLALPVLEAAAAEARARPVSFLGPAPFAALLHSRFPSVRYVSWFRARRWASLGELWRARPETALLLTESLSSAILVALAGVPRRIGYAAEGRGALLTQRVPRAGAARSAPRIEEYAALGRAAGLTVRSAEPRLATVAGERDSAAAALKRVGVEGVPFAVMAPGASYGPAKRWDPSRFAAVALHIGARHGLRSVLVGTEEDRRAAEEVATGAQDATVNLVGATDLSTLAGLLAAAAIVISNDSGVMHLAAALGRPTIGIFGSTSPAWTSTSAPWVRNLYAAYPCSPCFRRTCAIGYGCLDAIAAREAIEAAESLLAAGPDSERTRVAAEG